MAINPMRAPAIAEDSQQHVLARPGRLMGVLVVLALLLRVVFLGHKSFWLDEAATFFIVRTGTPAFWHGLWTRELNMGLYYVILRPWLHLGQSEFHIRLLSVIASVLTIPVVYLLGARLLSRRAGWLAALLLTVSAGHVAYAQEARAYALVTWLVALSSLFFLRIVGFDSEGSTRPSAWDCAGYVLCSAAAVYSHFFAVLAIAVHWLLLAALPGAVIRRNLRRLALSALFFTLLISPAAWFVLTRTTDQLAWIRAINFTVIFKTLALLAGTPVALVFYVPLWWLAIRRFRMGTKEGVRAAWPLWFLAAWLWFPFAILLAGSLHKAILWPRFVLLSQPAAVLLAAAGLECLSSRRERLVLVLMVLVSLGGVGYYYARGQEDWRGATKYVLQSAHSGDAVFIAPRYGEFGFNYYRQTKPHPATDVSVSSAPELQAPVSFQRAWVMVYGKQTEPEAVALHDYFARGYKLVAERHFKQIEVQLYQPLP